MPRGRRPPKLDAKGVFVPTVFNRRGLVCVAALLAGLALAAAGCGGGSDSASSSGAGTAAAVASTNFCPTVNALAASVSDAEKIDPKTVTKAQFESTAADLRKQANAVSAAFQDTAQVAAMNVRLGIRNLKLSRQGLPPGTTPAAALYHLRPSLLYLQKAIESARASFNCSASR
jgi:hypothetical protein